MQGLAIIRSEFLRELVNIKMSGLKYYQAAHCFTLLRYTKDATTHDLQIRSQ